MKPSVERGLAAMALGAVLVIAPPPSRAAAEEPDAVALWKKQCASCHGADGRGRTKAGRKAGVHDYTDPEVRAALVEAEMVATIEGGAENPDTGKTRMKAFREKLTDAEIRALVAHVLKLSEAS